MKKSLPLIIVVIVVVGVLAFFVGLKVGQATKKVGLNNFAAGNFQRFGAARQSGLSAVNGQIIAVDANSITVQLRQQPNQTGQGTGSKIVLYSNSTEISKFVNGTADDLTAGQNVMITGTANGDGSVTAQSIQIRPNGTIPQP